MDEDKVKQFEQDFFKINPKIIELLLMDHSTKRNIIWGTSNYKSHGLDYSKDSQITFSQISGRHHNLIRPRSEKSKVEQKKRSKDMAEVFTPSWVCNKQNNLIDNSWFDSSDNFNKEILDNQWEDTNVVLFNNGKSWKDYINDVRLEITCGEAPYLVSRYNTIDGEPINIKHRIGLLDRKLRVVNENVVNNEEWLEWAIKAVKSVYGFDFQGDNVFLARINILFDFIEYYENKIKSLPFQEILEKVAEIISWNIWQMDGLKFVVPYSCHKENTQQLSFFDQPINQTQCRGCLNNNIVDHNGIRCIIMDWESNKKIKVLDLFKGVRLW